MKAKDASSMAKEMALARNESCMQFAEKAWEAKPKWFAKSMKRMEKAIADMASLGKGHMFMFPGLYAIPFFSWYRRFAVATALADKGYYISVSPFSVYISWDWHHEGLAKIDDSLTIRKDGRWTAEF